MKKIIALLLAVLMLLGVLAGCGKDGNADQGTTPSGNGSGVTETEKGGSLVVTANASVIITYGTDGLVLGAEGGNKDGEYLLEAYDDLMGFSCAELVAQIIKDSALRTNMGRLTYVAVKFNKDASAPGTNFVETIEKTAKETVEEAAPDAKLIMILQEDLDAEGNIGLLKAKELVEGFLEVEKVDGFDGTDKPVDGFYSFNVSWDGMEEFFHVNANTGSVAEGALDGALQDPEETAPTEETVDPTEETELTEPTESAPVKDETESTEATA